jgi:hypothetical protein
MVFRNMKWLIVIFLIALASPRAYAKDPFACMFGGNVTSKGTFTFEIWRALTFGKDTTRFRLCESPKKVFLLVEAKMSGQLKVRAINLDVEQLTKLKVLYEGAFGVNFKDDAMGADGSSWCLEANRINYLKACFWSPELNTQARGIEGFRALGAALWDLAQFDGSNGELY